MTSSHQLTESIRKVVNAELDKRADETELGAADTSEVRITIKIKNRKAWRVLYSRVSESSFE